MSMTLFGTELFSREGEAAVHVGGKTQYRVTFDWEASEAHISGPGVSITVELEDDFHPMDDSEALALMLIAQLEGGVDL